MRTILERRSFFGLSLAIAMAALLLSTSSLLAASGSGGGGTREIRVEGTLTLVNTVDSFVQIRVQNGATVSVKVLSSTKIERNGLHVALSALRVGDRAQARIQTSTNMTTKLESVGP